jgi:hypothetical protein
MKRINNIFLSVLATVLLMGASSCFQDLGQDPAFDYPPKYVPAYNPLKLYLSFDENEKNVSNYRFSTVAIGGSYVSGEIGKAFQSADGDYVIATPPASLVDTIINLGSFTYAFWINAPRPDGVCGLLSIAKSDHSRGYVNLYSENFNDGNTAYLKGFLRTLPADGGAAKETWIDVGGVVPEGTSKATNVWNKWTHLAFRYNSANSTISIFRDGEAVLLNRVLGGGTFGPLVFDPAFCNGNIVFGALSPKAGQTTGTQDAWVVNAKTIAGQFDQIRFYNKALSDAEIAALYMNRE